MLTIIELTSQVPGTTADGLSAGPVSPEKLSQFGTLMSVPDHPHTACVHLGGAIIDRHDLRENAWYPGMQHAGMSVHKQPQNRHMQTQPHLPESKGYVDRGDLVGVSNNNGGVGCFCPHNRHNKKKYEGKQSRTPSN